MSKVRTTISIDKELMDWLNEGIKKRKFASVSHGIEFSVQKLIDSEEAS